MTAAELAEVWVPVPMRWRHIKPGDGIVGKDGALWLTTKAIPITAAISVELLSGEDEWNGHVDPDDVATVLLPAALRDAMTLTRDQLGARLLERRGAA